MNVMEQKVRQYKENAAGLSDILPEVARTYEQFTGQAFESGELDATTKQLIALGVALYANNEVCSFYHVQEARALGASDQQIMETVAVASAAASGHVLSQGVIRVQGALGINTGEQVNSNIN
ncbi:carboxymuconolactone decarboxylase family protein [Cohnella abietis]|uniref:DNA-binding protein n=1 Tax=Cohnella abietis TaxID=2507935 RepID=A0A3T1D3E8_9BACL|nr:carboxymuconolactone decarboxylase family protein [Cohnella abietis]BBI32633.1 DNA-binding protein [Cohnella abietis]